jgi:hypothetical protein
MPLSQAADFSIRLGENIGLLVVSDSNVRHADYLEVLILVHFAYTEMFMCRKRCRSNLRITAQ